MGSPARMANRKKLLTMKTLTKFAAVIALAWVPCVSASSAAAFPSRVITIVVPFPPGGPTDQSARLIGKALSARLGQSVIIDNKPGAGGTIGSAAVARATPDGYTLLLASTSTFGVAPLIYSSPKYSPTTSFAPLGMVARSPLVFVGKPGMKGDTLKDFIATAKVEKLSYGSAGNGSIIHLAAEWFKEEAGVDLLHVPYKGGAPALADLLGNRVDLTLETIPTVSPFLKNGRVKVLATAGHSRSRELPGVPTVKEVIGGTYEAYSWVGLVAPAHTPPGALKVLADAMEAAANDPATAAAITATGLEPVKSSPALFKRDIEAELAKWGRLVKKTDLKID
jgi:tripartite-type tricarboxylate transporter receptor subunit TctC